jgi:hypothetical protein
LKNEKETPVVIEPILTSEKVVFSDEYVLQEDEKNKLASRLYRYFPDLHNDEVGKVTIN